MRAAVVVLLAAAGCGGERAPAPAAAPEPALRVQVARAELRAQPTYEEVVGTVRAVRSASIAATLGATVAEVRVVVGSRVRAGDVLVRLSTRDLDARLEQARAAHGLARTEADRATRLHADQAIAGAQYDAAVAQLRVAEAALAEATTTAGHAILRAPFAGVVTAKQVEVGDTAMPGQTLLVVEAPDALRFEARLPEAAARRVGSGDKLAVRVEGIDEDVPVAVAEIDPTADPTTRTVLVKLDLPRDPRLRSGRFGRLLVATGASETVTVAAPAIVRRGQLETVFVVENGVARLRLVRTGRVQGGRVEVVSGLAGGELVAASDTAALVDGRRVEARL